MIKQRDVGPEAIGMKAPNRREGGFTLVELMVVLLIILVLVAISIPLYRGFRDRAVETEARAELRETLVPVKAYLLDGDGTAATLQEGAKRFSPNLVFDPSGIDAVMLQEAADGSVCLWRNPGTGNVYGIWQSSVGDTTLYATTAAIAAACPLEAAAAGAGFTATPW